MSIALPDPVIEKSAFSKHYDFFINKFPPLKIFSYNITIDGMYKRCKNNYCGENTTTKNAHTFYFEKVLIQALKSGLYSTKDPEEADLFHIPAYFGVFNMHKRNCDIESVILPTICEYPYYERYNGVDHVFVQMLFTHNNVPITPSIEKNLPSMITLGDLKWNFTLENPREVWRNTQMPYNSNFKIFYDFEAKERPLKLFLIGQFNLQAFDRRSRVVRRALLKFLQSLPQSTVIQTMRKSSTHNAGLFDIEAFMRHSDFCPVPHGDAPASKRLYDSFRTGCIPIIMADEIRLPFENVFLKYNEFITQIPQYNPSLVGLAVGYNYRMEKRIETRKRLKEVDSLLSVYKGKDELHHEKGDFLWGWAWMQFFKYATVSSVKRRGLLQSKYL